MDALLWKLITSDTFPYLAGGIPFILWAFGSFLFHPDNFTKHKDDDEE